MPSKDTYIHTLNGDFAMHILVYVLQWGYLFGNHSMK